MRSRASIDFHVKLEASSSCLYLYQFVSHLFILRNREIVLFIIGVFDINFTTRSFFVIVVIHYA